MQTNASNFDPVYLREKYRTERDKRLKQEGVYQYLEAKGNLSHYREKDPYKEERIREPIERHVEVLIIGAGFGGILAGIHLKKKGIEDLCIVDSAGDFGGTWYWNRYPGAQCDIESYIYMPMLEDMNYIPKEKYSFAPEILKYSQSMASKYNLYEGVLFHTEVRSAIWDESTKNWIVKTSKGDNISAKYICSSIGTLNKPKLPNIAGMSSFQGHSFHTSRWDYDYTGKSLENLKDKKVAIIGTGATGVQCIPHLANSVKELFVFQRTPSSIDLRGNKLTDKEWASTLKAGWQKKRMNNFNVLVTGGDQEEDLVDDGWTSIMKKLGAVLSDPSKLEEYKDLDPNQLNEMVEMADFEKMEEIRGRVDSVVKDPRIAESLKPYYRQFCKRPCFHDEYLNAYNLKNVHLIDTKGKGVDKFNPSGIKFDDKNYDFDCIIFATGFEVGTDYSRRAECTITGKDGLTLEKKWQEGVKTLHGFQTQGFPNLFFMGVVQGGLTANNTHMLTEQSEHIASIIDYAKLKKTTEIEISIEAENGWVEEMKKNALANEEFLSSCTPGYYNDEGKKEINGLFSLQYGGGPDSFFKILKSWRNNGFKGINLD